MTQNFKKQLAQYVKSYPSAKGVKWSVALPDGQGGQLRKRGFLSQRDAVHYAQENYLNVLNRKGLLRVQSKETFESYAERWLEDKRRYGITAATSERYGDELKIRIIPYFGSMKLKDIRKEHLRSFIQSMIEEGVSVSTVRYAGILFKQTIANAERDDLIEPTGMGSVKLPKHRQKTPVFWSPEQIDYFLKVVRGHRREAEWTLALFTGLRAGELTALRWSDVEFDSIYGGYKGVIRVQGKWDTKDRSYNEYLKGDLAFKIVPILPICLRILREMQISKKGNYVFGGDTIKDCSNFARPLRKFLENHPTLPRITFHGLRHSFCSYLDATGVNRRIISAILGHQDMRTTARYSHVNDPMIGRELVRWAEIQNTQETNKVFSDVVESEESSIS